MYSKQIVADLKNTIRILEFPVVDIDLSIPENKAFGDYSTNIALQLAKQKSKKSYHSSQEIANDILEKLGHPKYLERIEIAGPGFINFYLKDVSLTRILDDSPPEKTGKRETMKRVIVEYADPNTHKDFHIGHVRPLVFGESVARLFEYQGYQVYRSNYGSDIGPTVAKTLWGLEKLKEEYQTVKKEGSLREKAAFLGKSYALGHKNYETNESAKAEIDALTKKLYLRDPEVVPIWEETRDWSLAYFDTIYLKFDTGFDRRINESEVDIEGKKIVEENIGKVFSKNDGAVIFPGEKYGLHTRVFITSAGNPTYEAKELGLTRKYQELFPFDELIILSDNPQTSFFKVTIKAMELIDARLVGKKKHLPFGSITLTTGKMSSRLGNIISAEELIESTAKEIKNDYGNADQKVVVGAIKFNILKYGLTSDIAYDPKQSISLQGDTGPYVQYTYARTQSVLGKTQKDSENQNSGISDSLDHRVLPSHSENLTAEEREVLKHLEYFELSMDQVLKNLEPNKLAEYLLELAKAFNNFYQRCPILKSEREALRLSITEKVAERLKIGLYLLGIEAPERM
jgi:arginyl-tRNA synthetase